MKKYIYVPSRLILVLLFVFLAGCVSNKQLESSGQPLVKTPEDAVIHKLSPTSEIRPIDAEWSEYINHDLGIFIKFPKKVLIEGPYGQGGENPTVPLRVIENGEVITFSRSYKLNYQYLDEAGNAKKVMQDLSVRTPYFSGKYINDLSYPYQIYISKAENMDALKQFVERTYGEGCVPEGPSTYTDKPGIQTFTIADDNSNKCNSVYPVGDVVTWNPEKGTAVGTQAPSVDYFTKPYYVDPYDPAQQNIYDIQIEGLISEQLKNGLNKP